MHRSIRFKLFIYMLATIILFAVLLFAFNTFFAEKYYIYNKKHTLIKCSEELKKLIGDNYTKTDFLEEELGYEISAIEKRIGGTIVIGNSEGDIYYPLDKRHNEPNPGMTHYDNIAPPPKDFNGREQYNDNSFFIITKDPNFEINTLRFQIQEDNGILLLIWVPMAEISENAALSNNFTILVGFLTVFLTGFLTVLISDRFTKPIKDMNKLTKQMSKLDFSKALNINSKDELGELSQSINQLSRNLDSTIKELNLKNEKLEQDINHERQLDKMRREFVSNVSHELKTPIFLIQGYAEGLKTNIAESEEKKEFYCEVIMEEAEKMDILVKELLDLSHVESGMFTVNKTNFDLTELLEAVLSKYEQVLQEKEFQVIMDAPENIVIHADKVRVEQIIGNYINNAINYADEKKTIRITIENAGEAVRLSVYNSGYPIPADSLDKIWTSFYKVDKARTRGLGGTGLGLSIVRAIQEAHGNAYGVQNLEDGVVFWCEFT
jgi:two-component system, OmpR family, sensor histidine kinase VanS